MRTVENIKKYCIKSICLAVLSASLLSVSGCGMWNRLWIESGPLAGDKVIYKSETEASTDIVFPGAVEYTGKPHDGTDIYYVGKGENKKHIIVIDPGHQEKANLEEEPIGPGADEMKIKVAGGAESKTGQKEYELNLKVALILRDILIERGYSVVMTRETNNVDISNAERAEIANKYSASAFIRIHANSNEDTSVRGVQMLCQTASNPYPECAATYSDSRVLSEIIMNSYCEETDFKKLSIIETDTMSGINWCAVPTTIIEMGFLSNDAEDRYMATEIFKRSAAKGIADGIDEYIERINLRMIEASSAQISEATS